MKNIVLKCMVFIFALGVVSCQDDNSVIGEVFDNTTTGAFIRTLEEIQNEFDIDNPSSEFDILVEEQDEEFGALLGTLDIFVSFDGDNATTEEVLLKTYVASEFTPSEVNNLPSINLRGSYAELLAATGVDASIVNINDDFDIRLVLNLTDGRSFTDTDMGANIIGTAFFNAPMAYNIRVKDL